MMVRVKSESPVALAGIFQLSELIYRHKFSRQLKKKRDGAY